jgi:hypothetical protein
VTLFVVVICLASLPGQIIEPVISFDAVQMRRLMLRRTWAAKGQQDQPSEA